MIFSDKSLILLKSLSKVNKTVFLKEGLVQRAVNPESTVVVEVVLDEELPVDFPVYDLPKFLGILNAFRGANLEFTKHYVTITSGNGWKATFAACSPELVNQVATMEKIDSAPIALAFVLESETFHTMLKAAAASEMSQIAFVDTDEGIVMKAFNKRVSDDIGVSVKITDSPKEKSLCVEKPFIASTTNLMIEPDSYSVKISEMGFAQFESQVLNRRYIVLTEMEPNK